MVCDDYKLNIALQLSISLANVTFNSMFILESINTIAKQKHLGCKKVRGQSEATLQTGRRDQKVSLSTVVLNSRDRQGMYGMQHFRTPRNPPYKRL